MKFTKEDNTRFQKIVDRAKTAANKAGAKVIPTPMNVSGFGITETVSEGMCGFAWVNISGRGKFAQWMKKEGYTSPNYAGKGFNIWSSVFYDYNGQSYDRKVGAMEAVSRVLSENNIKAYASGRLD